MTIADDLGLDADEASVLVVAADEEPAYADYRDARLPRPLRRPRSWDLTLGPVSGVAGTTTSIAVQPQCLLFRADWLRASDTYDRPGEGTRVGQIFVGRRMQRRFNAPMLLTRDFNSDQGLAYEKLDTCEAAVLISVTVSFVHACTFTMELFGRAIV